MDSFKQQETELQQQLKQVCSERGRELNRTKSAEIFNKLGLLYKTKSPDKISLIQSAALLNAAIIRQPDNQKFQRDLSDLCKHVLRQARAEQVLANLVNIAKGVVTKVEQMRENVRTKLKNIKKLPQNLEDDERNAMERSHIQNIKSLQLSITSDYKRIMAEISQTCIKIMGSVPCKYTLVGLGSLARNEISPYSDFEHIMLLPNTREKTYSNDDSGIKEYFRWYSVLFHIIVINLQETIIPNVSIACLNDPLTPGGDWFWDTVTPQGISFDSLKPLASKVPLGRTQKTPNKPWTTELIKSVDEMVKYLEVDEDLKNGYKLADILTRTCYVDGDEMIYDEFCQQSKTTLKENQNSLNEIRKHLNEDLANLNIKDNISKFLRKTNMSIKRIIYRSITLFISALGRLHDVDEHSCFDIIDEFQRRHEINDVSAHRLSHSVAVACHVRLYHYMSKKQQDDSVFKQSEKIGVEAKIKELKKAVSKTCLVNCIATSFILQQLLARPNSEICHFDECFNELNFSAQLVSFNVLYLNEEGISFGERHLPTQENLKESELIGCESLADMYAVTGQHEKVLQISHKIKEYIANKPGYPELSQRLILNFAVCYMRHDKFLEVMLLTEPYLKSEFEPGMLYQYLLFNGLSKFALKKHLEALSTFRDLKKCIKRTPFRDFVYIQASIIHFISLCLICTGRIQQGLHVAREGRNLAANNEVLTGFFQQFKTTINHKWPQNIYRTPKQQSK